MFKTYSDNKNITFQTRMLISYWEPWYLEIGEILAPNAISLLI